MSDKLSDLIQVRLNAIDRLGLNSIARRASAHVYGEWKEQALALEQRVERLLAVVEPATHFAAAGYAEPQMDWRQALLDALAATDEKPISVVANEGAESKDR